MTHIQAYHEPAGGGAPVWIYDSNHGDADSYMDARTAVGKRRSAGGHFSLLVDGKPKKTWGKPTGQVPPPLTGWLLSEGKHDTGARFGRRRCGRDASTLLMAPRRAPRDRL